ncbi:MAG: WXG100 family type VII secretion target [Dactylosporangium sp.]|nr:WXG100 family type VII secretion target [Dactylosporangium sp.]NNJ61990.1 WXG100 family type VII secretion target [Dactylosporangium sp.]
MSETRVSVQVQTQTAEKFDQARQELESMLKRLLMDLEGLQTSWQGAGGRSFAETKRRWAEDQSALLNMLNQTAQQIRQSGKLYASAEAEAVTKMAAPRSTGLSLPL